MDKSEERYQHPAYGMLSFSRSHGNARFFGSELRHQNFITLHISNAELKRDATKEWYYADKEILRLRMTASTFAEAITSLNVGSGVPVTLEYVDGKKIDPIPTLETRKDFVHREFKERMKSFSQKLKTNQATAKELINKKTLSKEDQHKLNTAIEFMTTEIESNIPFFMECFQETADKVVLESKIELESAINHKITSYGMKAIQSEINNKQVTDFSD